MRIWLLTVGETFPMLQEADRKMRTALLAQKLVERGHQVIWWTSTVDHLRKRKVSDASFEVNWQDKLRVNLLDGPLYTKSISLRRVFNHIVIALRFILKARSERQLPDIIVASYPTPELAAAGAYIARRHGIPFAIDIRDRWPDELIAQAPSYAQRLAAIVAFPMGMLLRYALRRSTAIVAVSPSYAGWTGHHAPATHPEIVVIPLGYQAPTRSGVAAESVDELFNRGLSRDFLIFPYITTLNSGADIDLVIEAGKRLEEGGIPAQIAVAGVGEFAEKLVRNSNGQRNVCYLGWLNGGQIRALLERATAGLALYKAHSKVSLSNKFFEYLSHGLPIILTLDGDARNLVEEKKVGLHVRPGNVTELVQAISRFVTDVRFLAAQSSNAKKLFETDFDADEVYDKYAQYLERCVTASGRG